MTNPDAISSGVGFRNCVIFELSTAGYPKATSMTAYMGTRISGSKIFTITDPEPRKITHIGDDSIITLDLLPPQEAMSGEIHTGKKNDLVDLILSTQLAFALGDISAFGQGTDKRGFEAQVGMLAYRQAQDTNPASLNYGKRGWQGRLLPKTWLYSRDTGFNDQPEDHIYTVVPSIVTAHLWGIAFAVGVEGFTKGQMIRTFSYGKPTIAAFKSVTGAEVDCVFPADQPAINTNYLVWKNGVLDTTGTKTLPKYTFAGALTIADMVTIFYES